MSARRNACPGFSAPMPTGDGLLVRLLPAGRIGIDAFIAFCAAARQHGNGTIEITARGSVQVRGLSEHSAEEFAAAVAALGIAADGVPIIASPLDDDPEAVISAGALAAELRLAIGNLDLAFAGQGLTLAPKISVVVDSGGQLHLDALTADIRLRAIATPDGPRLAAGIAGDGASAIWLGTVAPDKACAAVAALLKAIVAIGPTARAKDLLSVDSDICRRLLRPYLGEGIDGSGLDRRPPPRPPAEPLGVHPLRDGMAALGITLAFGHADADRLARLAVITANHGAVALRPAAGRALLIMGVAPDHAVALAKSAARLGFITRPDDPRRRIVACPGTPACSSALMPTRELAATLVAALADSREAAQIAVPAIATATFHLSGCRKGCAHPTPAAVTVVGTERGCGIVRNDSAGAEPARFVAPAGLVAAVVAEAAHG
jgi:precorrin-3B synthase